MFTDAQVEELIRENARLRQPRVGKNRLCQGCENWRRFIAIMWLELCIALCLVTAHKAAISNGKTDAEFMGRLMHNPRFIAVLFSVAVLPLTLLIVRWNWLLWRHKQPCAARLFYDAFRWTVAAAKKYSAIAFERLKA
jgi:hypothetical protein